MGRAGSRHIGLAASITVAATLAGCGSSPSNPTSPTPADGPSSTTTAASNSAPTREEVRFTSDGFELVGDLHLPAGPPSHGALVMVSGSGAQTRNSTPTSDLVRQRFLDAGYGVLSWDAPGSGDSTGEFDSGFLISQRARIVADAVAFIANQPSVDSTNIGLWGLSQAGWVMPLASTMTDEIAFMIVVSGGGEDGIEQMVYQWTRRAVCRGATEAEAHLMDEYGPQALKAETYEEYRRAMEKLLTIRDLDSYVGTAIEMADRDDWVPWPRDIDAFFDPITVIERTTIPVLAVFGEHDGQVDPVQGAVAYRAALERAGNPDYRVETISGVDHTLRPTTSTCVSGSGPYSDRYLVILDEWLASHPAG